MPRTRFVFGHDKKLYPEGQFPPGIRPLNERPPRYGTGPAILCDIESFVSPIDGTTITSRSGLRAHCKEHDVVPTRELEGLPVKNAVEEYKPDREAIRSELKRHFYK